MKITCPCCGRATASYRPNCLHCNSDVNPRPLFDPDRAPEPWERRIQVALFVVLFMLVWLVVYFGPWNY